MDDLPKWAVEQARETFRAWLKETDYDRRACYEYDEMLQSFIAKTLASVAKAERERAARIASRDADWTCFGKGEIHEAWENGPDDARDYRIGIAAGRSIAATILTEGGGTDA